MTRPAFRSKNRALAESAIEIFESERPMTLRQLYYRLVSAGALRNTPAEYKRLGALMTRIREAGDVPSKSPSSRTTWGILTRRGLTSKGICAKSLSATASAKRRTMPTRPTKATSFGSGWE
jgi:hypothetical protein